MRNRLFFSNLFIFKFLFIAAVANAQYQAPDASLTCQDLQKKEFLEVDNYFNLAESSSHYSTLLDQLLAEVPEGVQSELIKKCSTDKFCQIAEYSGGEVTAKRIVGAFFITGYKINPMAIVPQVSEPETTYTVSLERLNPSVIRKIFNVLIDLPGELKYLETLQEVLAFVTPAENRSSNEVYKKVHRFAGMASPNINGRGIVWIYAGLDNMGEPYPITHSLIHEIAHQYSITKAKKLGKQAWENSDFLRAGKWEKKFTFSGFKWKPQGEPSWYFPSQDPFGRPSTFEMAYASTHPTEDFAETLSNFIERPAFVKATYPERYDWILKNVLSREHRIRNHYICPGNWE